jgi:hypothetical protein
LSFRAKDIPNSLNFKYVKDIHKGQVIYRPKVEIRLSNGEQKITLVMLIDSGADVSLIPSSIAEVLKLKISDRQESKSASGDFRTGKSEVKMELRKGIKSYDLGVMPIMVALDSDKTGSNMLLGRSNFFKKFDITFRENIFRILLKKPKKH